MRARLANHGIRIEHEATRVGARGVGHPVFFRDPFGNLLEVRGLAEYPDGRG